MTRYKYSDAPEIDFLPKPQTRLEILKEKLRKLDEAYPKPSQGERFEPSPNADRVPKLTQDELVEYLSLTGKLKEWSRRPEYSKGDE